MESVTQRYIYYKLHRSWLALETMLECNNAVFLRSHSCLLHNNDSALIWLPNGICFHFVSQALFFFSVCYVSEKFKPVNVYFVHAIMQISTGQLCYRCEQSN